MKKSKGFTLIELLVVIAIIGILATIVLVSLNSARSKARDTKKVADLRQIQLVLEMYYNDNSAYPVAATCTNATYNTMASTVQTAGYATQLPIDTTYMYGATASSYTLKTTLEATVYTTGPLSTDIDGTSNVCTCADPVYCVTP